jgi:FkbM family methyltransferase
MYEILRNIKNRLIQKPVKQPVPDWHRIKAGQLIHHKLYVNAESELFNEMIEGTYDAFFWNAIQPDKLKNSTIIDIGGHIGFHTMNFAKITGSAGKVMTFEPNRFNLERIRLNLSGNPDLEPVVELFNLALSESNGFAAFTFSANIENETSSGGFIAGSNKPLDNSVYERLGFVKEQVPVQRLDDIVKTNRVTNIQLIKIDVEGAEAQVLRGALQTLQQFHPMLLIEIHSVYCMKDVMDILQPLHYTLNIIKEEGPSRCFIKAEYNL